MEPLNIEAQKLIQQDYKIIQKGLWSVNCKKKLYVLGKRPGSSSMYKPIKDGFELYNFKKNNFELFDVTQEVEIECTTIQESIKKLEDKLTKQKEPNDRENKREIKKSLE